jgi:hypothetical protein
MNDEPSSYIILGTITLEIPIYSQIDEAYSYEEACQLAQSLAEDMDLSMEIDHAKFLDCDLEVIRVDENGEAIE